MTEYVDRPEYNIPDDGKHHHPAADDAMVWFQNFVRENPGRYLMIKEALYSTALSGNDLANYCVGTIKRLAAGAPVSDRYMLGLAWAVRSIAENDYADTPNPETRKDFNSARYGHKGKK